jgi:peptide/nickel transport system substrate-binding protein
MKRDLWELPNMPETRNIAIAVVLIVVIVGAGAAYILLTTPPAEDITITVGTTFEIGRVPHPLTVHGGDDPIVVNIFEGLVGYVGDTLVIEPVLATALPTVSADGLEYTFNLRENVLFHDGTEFNASAVNYYFDLIFTDGAGMTYIFTEGLLNHTEVVSEFVIKFVLNNPNSDFLQTLCHMTGMIPSPTAIETYGVENVNDHPIGTGPLKFVSKIIDTEVVLDPFDDWWQLAEGEEITVSQVIFVQVADPATLKLSIESGEIDLTDGRFNVADYESLLANTDLTTYDVSGSASRRWMTFNMNETLWDVFPNKTMRQAFAYAIPYDEIISVGLGGLGERQYSFLPPEYIGYKEVFDYDYNATKALELIAEAGHTTPVEVSLHITPTHYGTTEPDIAALIKSRALDAGFDVTIVQEEYAAYKTSYKTTGTQEINLWAWTANYPSTDDWATQFMASDGWGTGFSMALDGDMGPLYPYVDDLIVEAAGTTNETRKIEILEELQDLWAEWVPNIFVWREVRYQFSRANIQGLVFGAQQWDFHLHNLVKT